MVMDEAEVVSVRTLERVLQLEAARWVKSGEVFAESSHDHANLYGYDVVPLEWVLVHIDAWEGLRGIA
jgi:hypothetical protein